LVAGDKAVSLPAGQHDATAEQASQKPAPSAQNESNTQAPALKQEREHGAETSEVAKTEVLPKHGPKAETASQEKANEDAAKPNGQDTEAAESNEVNLDGTNDAPAPAVKAPPTSWANLFAKTSARAPVNGSGVNGANGVNGESADATDNFGSAFSKSNANSLAEAIQSFVVENNGKLDFLEPRGLINTGNMCYMNSVSLCLRLIKFRETGN
jgi:ubiquitin carboxyl-terminal hydrolase 10